jgi:small subunit ribosomal protein S21
MRNNYQKPRIKGTNVEVRNDDVSGALRRLRKILEKENRQKDLARHEFYEKPSSLRNRAKAAARKRHEKEINGKRERGELQGGISKTNLSYMKSKRKRRKVLDQSGPVRHNKSTAD